MFVKADAVGLSSFVDTAPGAARQMGKPVHLAGSTYGMQGVVASLSRCVVCEVVSALPEDLSEFYRV